MSIYRSKFHRGTFRPVTPDPELSLVSLSLNRGQYQIHAKYTPLQLKNKIYRQPLIDKKSILPKYVSKKSIPQNGLEPP